MIGVTAPLFFYGATSEQRAIDLLFGGLHPPYIIFESTAYAGMTKSRRPRESGDPESASEKHRILAFRNALRE
jgi:hypothetical protein